MAHAAIVWKVQQEYYALCATKATHSTKEYCQVFSTFNVTFQLEWPTAFVSMLDSIKLFNIDILQFFKPIDPCSFDLSFLNGFYAHMMVLPVCLFIVFSMRYLIASANG